MASCVIPYGITKFRWALFQSGEGLSMCRGPHIKWIMIGRLSCLYNGNSYADKIASLYEMATFLQYICQPPGQYPILCWVIVKCSPCNPTNSQPVKKTQKKLPVCTLVEFGNYAENGKLCWNGKVVMLTKFSSLLQMSTNCQWSQWRKFLSKWQYFNFSLHKIWIWYNISYQENEFENAMFALYPVVVSISLYMS